MSAKLDVDLEEALQGAEVRVHVSARQSKVRRFAKSVLRLTESSLRRGNQALLESRDGLPVCIIGHAECVGMSSGEGIVALVVRDAIRRLLPTDDCRIGLTPPIQGGVRGREVALVNHPGDQDVPERPPVRTHGQRSARRLLRLDVPALAVQGQRHVVERGPIIRKALQHLPVWIAVAVVQAGS
jgi:hypothetical protein